MKKLVMDAQQHFLDNNNHEIHVLLVGVPADHGLPGLAMIELREVGRLIHVSCPEVELLELENILKSLDTPRMDFGIGSVEQLTDELLANLGKEAVALHAMSLESVVEHHILPQKQSIYGIIKTPLKSAFNNRSRQVSKSVRRKK